MRRRWRGLSRCWSGHDLGAEQCSGVAGDRTHRYAQGIASLSLQVQQVLRRDPLGGHLFCFRGRSGNLLKVIWHDGQGACLFTKRLERGRFLWPGPADGAVTISPAQLGYLLSGIDWRHPQETWRPTSVG
jgi:transposase